MSKNIRKLFTLFAVVVGLTLSANLASAQAACEQDLIVGAWRGITSEGNHIVMSFTGSGNVIGSVQTEVSLKGTLGILTPAHGTWACIGSDQYSFTSVGLLYSAANGNYRGYLKARGLVTVDPSNPNVMTGSDKVTIYGPNGDLLFEVPAGQITWTRTVLEPFN